MSAPASNGPQPVDPTTFEFRYQLHVPSGDPLGPWRLFDRWQVVMEQLRWPDGAGEPERTPVAHATAVLVRPFRCLYERLLFDAADEAGGDLATLVEVAFSPDGFLEDDLLDQVFEAGANVLFLDNVTVEQAHRGNGYGWQIAADLIVTLSGGCAAAVTFPAPVHGSADEGEYAAACQKLADYWSATGFFDAGRDNLFLLDLADPHLGLLAALGPGRYEWFHRDAGAGALAVDEGWPDHPVPGL